MNYKEFKTDDLQLSAVFHYLGFKPFSKESGNSGKTTLIFKFNSSEELESIIRNFYLQRLSIEPVSFLKSWFLILDFKSGKEQK